MLKKNARKKSLLVVKEKRDLDMTLLFILQPYFNSIQETYANYQTDNGLYPIYKKLKVIER